MAEYSRLAKGHVTATGGSVQVNLPFQPDFVELINYTALTTPTSGFVTNVWWDNQMGQGAAAYLIFNGTPVLTSAVTASGGISSFSAGQSFQYGARQQIIGATAANPIVFNVTAHGYQVGDTVILEGLYQSATTGMPQISGMPFVISAVGDANHFSVVWPGGGSNYTALSGSPAGAYVQKVLYPYLYAPGVAFIEAISLGASTTVTTTSAHNFVVGQEVAFRIPSLWGTVQLNSLPNGVIPGNPLYYYVTSVTNSTTFVCNAVSSSFTAFNTNQTVASVPGLSFPQVVAAGDVNSGGVQLSAGSALYPSPVVNGVSTINGPAIQGAFVNNTRQGFVIGPVVAPTAAQVIYWRAFVEDYAT